MSRQSSDQLAADGTVEDGFDYALQVWVRGGVVQPCGHPESMKQRGPCCAAERYKGQAVAEIAGRQVSDKVNASRLIVLQGFAGIRAMLRRGEPLSQADRDAVAELLDQGEEFINFTLQSEGEGESK